jgi:casein kinase II subunit alpha
MFSAGLVIAEFIFRKVPIIKPCKSTFEHLVRMMKILGTKGYWDVIKQKRLTNVHSNISFVPYYKRQNFSVYVNDRNRGIVNHLAIDLVEKLLQWDGSKRLSAKDAMTHEYFKKCRI